MLSEVKSNKRNPKKGNLELYDKCIKQDLGYTASFVLTKKYQDQQTKWLPM